MTTLPAPRPGPLGAWDRLVGPGMGAAEAALVIGVAAAGALVVGARLSALGLDGWRVALGALLALDVLGGVVCNMTRTTRRWYHRDGRGTGDHLATVGMHVVHVVLVAWAFGVGGSDAAYAAVIGGWLLFSAAAVLRAPDPLRGPVAAAAYVVALGLAFHALSPIPGMEWFVPALFLKLLIGHLQPPPA